MLHCPTCGQDFAEAVRVCPEDGAPLQADSTVAMAPPPDPLIGLTLDEKYRLDSRLGTGGMGTVYRATHMLIDRPVAVKVLNPRYVEDEAAQTRFRREARAAGRLQHTNAVTVTDFGRTQEGLVYIVMELLEGQTLREVLTRDAPLDTARAVSMTLQIAAAVGAAHDAGVIHRDLKPANIFIVQRKDAPPFVKVLDFGIAKLAAEAIDDDDHQTLTQVGAMIGTPRYMSPEQCEGEKLTPASDVYSIGIILYEMLTGTTPFNGTSPIAIAIKHSSVQPRSPREFVATIPPALESVVLHALEKRPEDRPSDANKLRLELFAVAEHLGLEHAGSISAPTMETLRNAGTETPSGRLVIDIERLRESRAAAHAAQSAVSAAQSAAIQPVDTSPNGGGAPTTAQQPPLNTYQQSQGLPHFAPAIARFRVFFGKREAGGRWLARHLRVLLVGVAALVLVGLAVVVYASRQSKIEAASAAGEGLSSMTSFGAGGGALAGPDAGKGRGTGGQRREARDGRGAARGRSQSKEPSRVKRIWNKAKKIFKNPF